MKLIASWFVPLLALAACNDNQLPLASIDNVVDTVTLGALVGADITIPAAYSIPEARTIRTDQSAGFDFAYLVVGSRSVLVPLAGLGLNGGSTPPGLQRSNESFANLKSAPSNGYLVTDSLDIAAGDVFAARSRIVCFLGVPQYAKLRVIDFDAARRTVRLEVLANTNCGYRGLEVGIPTS
ncbi:MAG: hypothetical protein H0W15_10415 [Gemmatimonadales bacterium]|nr:hypothetical protein [Gemmatimonadales bacterium]